jgi:hypothetical protein
MSARKSAPAKHHGGGDGQDAAVRQGERNPTHLDVQEYKMERKRAQKSAGTAMEGTHTFPAQRLNKPNAEANLKRVAMDAATDTQGSGKVDLPVNTAFKDQAGTVDTSDDRRPVRLYLCGARRGAAQATRKRQRDQGKCDRTQAGLDAAQSHQPSSQQGKNIHRRHAHGAGPRSRRRSRQLLCSSPPQAGRVHHRRCSADPWRRRRRMRRHSPGKASGEATMMQQGHTPRDRAMTPMWSVCGPIFSLGVPSSRRIPREWSSALTTTGGNPATLKAL